MPPESGFEGMVLRELAQVREDISDLRAQVVGVRVDVATLKVKSGIWGAAAGFVPSALTFVVIFATGAAGGG